MRILIVSQYFWPESFIINDLSASLARAGHGITVLTGKPNYPYGEIYKGYSRTGIERETFADAVEVIRVPLRPRGRSGARGLITNYMSFLASGLVHAPRLLKGRSFDAVLFFGVAPLTAAIPATLVARIKRAHLALWIQDLWPDSLPSTGYVTSGWALWIVRQMMKAIYAGADTLLLQSKAFMEPVAALADPAKMVHFPNPAPDIGEAAAELPPEVAAHFDGVFSVVFAGNLGRVQSVDTIVATARSLSHRSDIRFVIAGTGSEAGRFRQMVEDQGLKNVVFTGSMDRSLMPALFRLADVLLVTLKNERAMSTVVPSKISAYMQAAKPIIGALNGEGARLLRTSGGGFAVDAEDHEGLSNLIISLYSEDPEYRESLGRAARRYYEEHLQVAHIAERLVHILEERIGVGRRGE